MLTTILQLLISGIAMGFIYGLVGIEYTLVWNSAGLLNFSHEKIIMLGAYVFVGTGLIQLGMDYLPAIAIAVIALVLFGILIANIIFIPLRNKSRLVAIVATVMLGQVINEGVILIWGPYALSPYQVSSGGNGFMAGTTKIGEIAISNANLIIIAVAIVLIVLLQVFLKLTRPGKATACVAQNKTAAALMGINVKRSMALSIALSFVVCCTIGIITSPLYVVGQTMATMISLKGFVAGVIGGFGNLPAAIVGGLVLGVVENIVCIALPSVFKDVVSFVLMILFMLFFPKGIFGTKRKKKLTEEQKREMKEAAFLKAGGSAQE